MKAIFRFRNPGPTSDNFASMTVVNFKVCQSSKTVDIEQKTWICYPLVSVASLKFSEKFTNLGQLLKILLQSLN